MCALLASLPTVISALAFLVAVATLYYTALRRADINVDEVEHPRRSTILGHSTRGERYSDAIVMLEMTVSNTGARAGVLQFLSFRLDPDDRHAAWPHVDVEVGSGDNSVPLGLQGGDVNLLRPEITMGLPETPLEELASALAEEWLDVRIDYSFQRAGMRKQRETVRRHLVMSLSLSHLRSQVIAHWSRPGVFVNQVHIDKLREASP